MWRELFNEYEGGDVTIKYNQRIQLQQYKQCASIRNLSKHLDSWYDLVLQVGADIGEETLQVMLIDILPEEIKKYVRKRLGLDLTDCEKIFKSAQSQAEHVKRDEIVDYNKKTSLNALTEKLNNLYKLVESGYATNEQSVAAIQGRQPQRPGGRQQPPPTPTGVRPPRPQRERPPIDTSFNGCWHCGKPNHSRRACRSFLELLADNGGKLPKDYQGEYEKHIQNKRKTVAAVGEDEANELHEDTEDEDSDAGSQCGALLRAPPRKRTAKIIHAISKKKTDTKNQYDALTANDENDTDDTTKIHDACKNIAHKITVDTKTPKTKHKPQIVNLKTDADIDMLVNMIRSKHANVNLAAVAKLLPKDQKHLLACVDSGSVVTVVDAEKELPTHNIQKSKAQHNGVQYAAANGSRIPNEGKVQVTARTTDGIPLPPLTFQNAKVSMPILSVRRLVRKGSRVEFLDGGGIIHLPDGKGVNFIEKFGLYFIHLIVDPPDGAEQGTPSFTGPGS